MNEHRPFVSYHSQGTCTFHASKQIIVLKSAISLGIIVANTGDN